MDESSEVGRDAAGIFDRSRKEMEQRYRNSCDQSRLPGHGQMRGGRCQDIVRQLRGIQARLGILGHEQRHQQAAEVTGASPRRQGPGTIRKENEI